jgi:hypothetical protein
VAWFDQSSMMEAVAPSGALAPRFALVAVVLVRAPSPCVESAREASVLRLNGSDMLRRKMLGFGWRRSQGSFYL